MEWISARVPVFRQVQVNDYAKHLGVMIGPGAATHRRTNPRNNFVSVCVCPHSLVLAEFSSKDLSFNIHALSVLTFVGSMAEPDKETISAETAALQRLSAGFLHALPQPCSDVEAPAASKLTLVVFSSRARLPDFALLPGPVVDLNGAHSCRERSLWWNP